MEENETDTETPRVNPGHALFQIAKALTTSEQHKDAAARERARQRTSKWLAVLNGILAGTAKVGSRTPLEGVPGWATLEVVTGGFATGALLAGGPLLEHERASLTELSPVPDSDARRLLNGYYLTEDGLAQLRERLRTGRYDVGVPEEGALLVVAWLTETGHVEEARTLLEELGPYFRSMRFYPIPMERPGHFGSRVFLQDVRSTVDDLKKIKPNRLILAQKEAIEVWAPLYDLIVQLFLETVEGEPPSLRLDSDGKRMAIEKGRFPVEGGWPCQNYTEGWPARAEKVLDECDRMRAKHTLCGRADRSKESFAQLREYLRRCVKDPKSLSGRDVGRVRLILARYIAKRGTPDSLRCKTVREKQAQQASAPTFHEISQVIVQRLGVHPQDGGLDDLSAITQPVTAEEADRWTMKPGTSVPRSLHTKIERCLSDTVESLVERRVITSAETLARILPQMTSELRAAGISDPTLRQLYAAIYRAFRRRRSLLLVNLQSQIKLEELPWVAAIDRFRRDDMSTRELAKQALEEVAALTIASFPQAILPNKLIQELRALAKGADLSLPLVDELAADIFMGQFSNNFLQAAKRAADLLEGTLYENYYGIDYSYVREMPEAGRGIKSWFSGTPGDPFAQLCSTMAGVTHRFGDPAANGMIIEQQQILTTQNLAVLCDGLDLGDVVRDRFEDMARRCFIWICRRQQVKTEVWHASLIMLKDTAYAWRQMVFFLALIPSASVRMFLTWADEHLDKQEEEFQSRFRPALQGLVMAAQGRSLDDPSTSMQGTRRFLGWSKTRHWLLGAAPERRRFWLFPHSAL